jgi:hypothetical protein
MVRVLPKPKSAVAAKGDKNLVLKIAYDQLVLLTLLCLPSSGGAGFLLFRRAFYGQNLSFNNQRTTSATFLFVIVYNRTVIAPRLTDSQPGA